MVKMQLLNGATGMLSIPAEDIRKEKINKKDEFKFENQSNETEIRFVYTRPRIAPTAPVEVQPQ
jgi:hypothetical protein